MSKLRRFKKQDENVILEGISSELYINTDRLNEELLDQPIKFKKWVELESEALKHLKNLENSLEIAEAEAYVKAKASGQKMTVKDLESAVALDEAVKLIKEQIIEAEAVCLDMKGAVRAFHQRHEALKDLCANKRKELID